jgi:hypothetical protein
VTAKLTNVLEIRGDVERAGKALRGPPHGGDAKHLAGSAAFTDVEDGSVSVDRLFGVGRWQREPIMTRR